jgi:hypothetical protein
MIVIITLRIYLYIYFIFLLLIKISFTELREFREFGEIPPVSMDYSPEGIVLDCENIEGGDYFPYCL